MREYWIETQCFAISIGKLTPEQRACFCKWCNEITAKFDEFLGRTEDEPAFIVHDYTPKWEDIEPDTDSEKIIAFWKEVKGDEEFLDTRDFGCTLVKIFPENVIQDDFKGFLPAGFVRKKRRCEKIWNNISPLKDIEKNDWLWLSTFLDFAEAARGNNKKPNTQGEPSSVIAYPYMTQVASEKGNPIPAIDAFQKSIEWADAPAKVIIKNPNDISGPVVKAIEKQIAHLERRFQQPIAVKDTENYGDTLRAIMDSKHPDEKYKHWVMWKNGKGFMEIAKLENSALAGRAKSGDKQAQKTLESKADTIRRQIERMEKSMSDKKPDKNNRKTKKAL